MRLQLRNSLVVPGGLAAVTAILLLYATSRDRQSVNGGDAPASNALHESQETAPEAETSSQLAGPSSERIRGWRAPAELLGGAEMLQRDQQYPTEPGAPGKPASTSTHSRITIELEGGGYKTGALVNGLPQGLWQVVDDTGNVLSEIPYKGGKIHGKMTS